MAKRKKKSVTYGMKGGMCTVKEANGGLLEAHLRGQKKVYCLIRKPLIPILGSYRFGCNDDSEGYDEHFTSGSARDLGKARAKACAALSRHKRTK
jgi:hypothetical protein